MHVHYCNPAGQGPFQNEENYGNGIYNNVGPYPTMDEAVLDAQRRMKGCESLNQVRVRKDRLWYGKTEPSWETVVVITK